MVEIEQGIEITSGEEIRPGDAEFCLVNYAVVSNVRVEDIPRIARFIGNLTGAKVIYQTKSVGRLRIVRE